MAIKKITVRQDQTIYDIAIQYYGGVNAVFSLMEDNPEMNLETDLETGQTVRIDDEKVTDESIRAYFKARDLYPAHGGGEDPGVSAFTDGFKQDSVT